MSDSDASSPSSSSSSSASDTYAPPSAIPAPSNNRPSGGFSPPSTKRRRLSNHDDQVQAGSSHVHGEDPPAQLTQVGTTSKTNNLASWLSLRPIPPTSLPTPLLTSSPIFDKDSIFISYAMSIPPSILDPNDHQPPKLAVEKVIKLLTHDHERLPDVVAGRGDAGGKRRKKIKPNHNMWAYRVGIFTQTFPLFTSTDHLPIFGQTLTLIPNRKGTSETDYTVKEASDDDGERWAGERLIKVMREEGAVDCLVICSRWFGGTLLGPARFTHIDNSARSAISSYQLAEILEPLYDELTTLDNLIIDFRKDLAPLSSADDPVVTMKPTAGIPDYRLIKDPRKLENLIKAKSRTVQFLGDQVAERAMLGGDDDDKGREG